MSIVPLLALGPHQLSGRIPSAMVGTSLLSKTLPSNLSAMESRVIPRSFLEQSDFSPLFLYRAMGATITIVTGYRLRVSSKTGPKTSTELRRPRVLLQPPRGAPWNATKRRGRLRVLGAV